MRQFVCAAVILASSLRAEDDAPFSLINEVRSPIERVAGGVNLVSGHWVDTEEHLENSSPDGVPLAHSYVSSSAEEGSLADGWDLFFPSDLEVFQPKGITYVSKGSFYRIKEPEPSKPTLFYREAGGATVVFKGSEKISEFEPKLKKAGYQHINSIEHPSRRNIHRIRIHEWRSHSDSWAVTLGDGTKRIYERSDKHKKRPRPSEEDFFRRKYRICEEKLPSGNKRFYSYDSNNEIKKIETRSSSGLLIHRFTFDWQKSYVKVTSSDNLSARFFFKKLKDNDRSFYLITKIERPGKPPLFYEYSEKSSLHVRRVRHKRDPRHTRLQFYHEGVVAVGDKKISVAEDDFLLERVRALYTKSLPGEASTCSHSFSYHKGETRCRAKVKESDGYHSYHYWTKEDSHPVLTVRRDPKGRLLTKERYVWNQENLIGKVVYDDTGTPQIASEYIFDNFGNVTREVIRGAFLHPSSPKITLDEDNSPHGGDKITLHARYNERSLKTAEQDPLGNWTYFQYDETKDLLTARITCNGTKPIRREFFSYNTAAVRTKEVLDDGHSFDKHNMSGVTRRYVHTIRPREKTPFFEAPEEERWTVWSPSCGEQLVKRLSYIRDKKGRAVEKQLFDNTNTLQKRWHYTFDEVHRITQETDPTGTVTKYTYNEAGLIASKKCPLATFFYRYDLFGRMIEEKKVFPDKSSSFVSYSYSLSGRKREKTDERGRAITTRLDSLGRVISITGPALYTEKGIVRPVTTTTYTGRSEAVTSPSGATTTTLRSSSGKPLKITSPLGSQKEFFYDKKDRLIKEKESNGLTTYYQYDALNRIIKTVQKEGSTVLSTKIKQFNGFDLIKEVSDTKETSYSYDTLGRKAEEVVTDLITKQFVAKRFEYDGLGRLISIENLDLGTTEISSYDKADRVIEHRSLGKEGDLLSLSTRVYDAAGRVVDQTTGSISTKTAYSTLGLPKTITYNDGTQAHISSDPLYRHDDGLFYFKRTTTNARGISTEELLDANDSVRFLTIKDKMGKEIFQKKISVNILGKPTRVETTGFTENSSETITGTLTYDLTGQPISCTLADKTPDSASWHYSYDENGRKVEEKKPSGTSLFFSYDARGNLSSLKSSDGTIDHTYTYNQQNLPVVIDNSGKVTKRSYDGSGNILSETLENGLSLSYERTPSGLLKTITYPDQSKSLYSYKDGRLSSIERCAFIYSVNTRNLFGRITQETFGSAGCVERAFDIMGRPTLVSHPSFCEERTLFDPVGNCTERKINGKKERFSYDSLSHLTKDNSRSASYDSFSRRLKFGSKRATHNTRHQILSQGREKFIYDIDGRRVKDGKWIYTYDALDHLISAEDNTTRIEYSYDPFSRRTSSTTYTNGEKSSFEKYLWQDEHEIGSFSDTQTSLRILGEGLGGEIGAAVLMELSENSFVPIHDLSGNVRNLLEIEGNVQEEIFYTATGPTSLPSLSPWSFSSKRHDLLTHHIYFGKRYYDPSTSTWLTQDPLGQMSASNLYTYVNNNPLTTVDHYGLFGISDAFNAVYDFVSSVWDGACNFCSSIGDHFFGSSPGESFTSSTYCENVIEETTSEILEKTKHRLSHSDKGFVSFVERANKGIKESLESFREKTMRVASMINGILTGETDAFERLKEFLGTHEQYHAGLLCYNATEGIFKDVWEAICNSFGFEGQVGTTIKEGVMNFVDIAKKYNIAVEMTLIGHSQGAAISRNLCNSKEFGPRGEYENIIQQRINVGGATIDPDATNYIARRDFIPFLNPLNWIGMLYSDVRFIKPSQIASHFFENYKQVLSSV